MPENAGRGYEPFKTERARDETDLVREAAVMNVAPYLKGIEFPVDKGAVRDKARAGGADEAALEEIERLPERTFATPTDLITALGRGVDPLLDKEG